MHYTHTGEAVVTSIKIDIFLLVTTRLIAHSGQSECFRNCVVEHFSMLSTLLRSSWERGRVNMILHEDFVMEIY